MRHLTALLLGLALLVGCAADDVDDPVETDDTTVDESADDDTDEADPEPDAENDAGDPAVAIVGFSFEPATISIDVGDTVLWINEDSARHNVTSDDDVFASDNLADGESFTHTFDEAGTFDYVCTLHSGMSGTVEVS